MSNERKECLDILRSMFTNNVNYPFDTPEKVSCFEEFVDGVLSNASSAYTDEHYYRDNPDFKDFLYSHHVDSIAYYKYSDMFE